MLICLGNNPKFKKINCTGCKFIAHIDGVDYYNCKKGVFVGYFKDYRCQIYLKTLTDIDSSINRFIKLGDLTHAKILKQFKTLPKE